MSALAVVITVALGFALMGAAALARPALIVGHFGIDTLTAEFRNEVRAVYGGFGLAVAGMLLVSLVQTTHATGMQVAVAVSLLGMAAGRLISWSIERTGCWPWVFGAIEVLAGGSLWLVASS